MKHEKLIVALLFMILAFQSPRAVAGIEGIADGLCLGISLLYLLAYVIDGVRDAWGGRDA